MENPSLGYKIQGSNDNNNWTDLYTSSIGVSGNLETFPFNNLSTYLYYRLFSSSGNGVNP